MECGDIPCIPEPSPPQPAPSSLHLSLGTHGNVPASSRPATLSSGSMTYQAQSLNAQGFQYRSHTPLPSLLSTNKSSLFTRTDDLFSTSSSSDVTYNSFFRSLRPPSPQKQATSYENFWSSQSPPTPAYPHLSVDQALMQPPPTHPAYTPAQSNHISTASIDRILMQAPPTGHAMFSNTSPKKANSNARHLSLSDLTRHLPTFGQFQSSDNFSMETSFETPSQKRKDRSSAPADTPSPHGQPPKRPKPSFNM
ncbi:hypothetical protein B0H13DRAFT_2563080 [Mycena leptocephala]|nr:hypothetical protein B0H13DRAFT_2563080 [Mycena leptocephala]